MMGWRCIFMEVWSDLREFLRRFEGPELDYVWSRSKSRSRQEALRNAHVSEGTYYHWSSERRAELEDAANELRRNRYIVAEMVLLNAVEKAAEVVVEDLKEGPKYSPIRQKAALEILDRVLGRARQGVELTGNNGGPVEFRPNLSALGDEELAYLADIADRVKGD